MRIWHIKSGREVKILKFAVIMILKVQTVFGTTYSKSALWYEKSDSIETWEYPINVTVTINDGFEDEVCDDMFLKNISKNLINTRWSLTEIIILKGL